MDPDNSQDRATISGFRTVLERVVNKYNKLEGRPLDFGTGEVLHPSEIHVIEAVGDSGGTTVTALAARFGITKGAVSQMVTRLEKKGYVTKVKGRNEKEVLLGLSSRGMTALGNHARLHQRMDADLAAEFSRFGPLELSALQSAFALLDTMLDSWDKALESGNSVAGTPDSGMEA